MGHYRVKASAVETGFYEAAEATHEFWIMRASQDTPDAPEANSRKADRITIKTVSGQRYICTTANTEPDWNTSGWQTASGSTLTFENLKADTTYYIWTYIPEKEDGNYDPSEVSDSLQTATRAAAYTVTIPAGPLTAGSSDSTAQISVNKEEVFDIGYGEKITVSVPESVNLVRKNDPTTTLTSALLVNGNKHTGGALITFDTDNYQSASATIQFDKPVRTGGGTIPAGDYEGKMTFTISYND